MHLCSFRTCFSLCMAEVSEKQVKQKRKAIGKKHRKSAISGNFRTSAQQFRSKYIERVRIVQEKVKFLLNTSRRDIWKCDPRQYSVGTYEEVTNFLQGYIDNEVNLNTENDCKLTCADYKLAEHKVCSNGTYCALETDEPKERQRICRGKIVDCEFIGSDLNICESVS